MSIEHLLVGGAISFNISILNAELNGWKDDFAVYCKILVHAWKDNVKYRYKSVTDSSNIDYSWESPESFKIPLDPSPTELQFFCYKKSCNKSEKKLLLGQIKLSRSFIQSFEKGTGTQVISLDIPKNDTNNELSIDKSLRLTCKLDFDIDKQKYAHYLFNIFPEEILLHIFMFVDYQSLQNISLVNKQWNRLTRDHRLLYIMGNLFCYNFKIFYKYSNIELF